MKFLLESILYLYF